MTGFGKKTPPHNFLMSTGKIHLLVHERIPTTFWYGERTYLCFFHRMKLELNWYSVWNRIILVQMLLMIIRKSHSGTYWTCDPGPPILYLAVCERKEMVVIVNDANLGQPATQEFSRFLENFLMLGTAKEFLYVWQRILFWRDVLECFQINYRTW